MAACLVAICSRTRLRGSSLLSRITEVYQRERAALVGDVCTSWARNGSQTYGIHEVMLAALPSRGAFGWRVQHPNTALGWSKFILSNSALECKTAALGMAITPRVLQVRHQHTDEWLVQRARAADVKRRQARQRARPILISVDEDDEVPFLDSERKHILPVSPEEEKIAGVLGRPDLIITRNVEWANLAFGFEQQNKYVIMDPREPRAPVGYILEDSNILMRQFLRRRRPFVAHVLDGYGNEICRVRRPIWFINSTIYVEVDGKVIGEAHRRWHLWKRIYDCYLGDKQFAAVENPGFWYWTFTLHDENEGVLAVIDRNWRGFGFEFLTDAGQYVIRFGDSVPSYVPGALRPQPDFDDVRKSGAPILSGSPTGYNEMKNLQTAAQEAERLVVTRPLSLSERAVTLALAVSLDNDYFSHHSSGMGFIPLPFIGGSEVADNVSAADNYSGSDHEAAATPLTDDSSVPPDFPSATHTDSPTDHDSEQSWVADASFQDEDNFFVDPFDWGSDDLGSDN